MVGNYVEIRPYQ